MAEFSHVWSVVTNLELVLFSNVTVLDRMLKCVVSGDCQETMLIPFKSNLEVELTDKRSDEV